MKLTAKFLLMVLGVAIVLLLAVFIAGVVFSWIGFFPPPHIPWSQVNVAYSSIKVSPNSDVAYFVKVVTQEKKGKAWAQTGMFEGHWQNVARRLWTTSFLCRSKKNGTQPEVVCEITSEKLPALSANFRPPKWDSWGTIRGFDVSWSEQKAVIVLGGDVNNFAAVDFQSKHVAFWTNPISPYHPLKIEMIENGTKVLLSTFQILDFDKGLKNPPDQIKAQLSKMYLDRPLWNEDKHVLVLRVRPTQTSLEWWVCDGDLNLVEKVDYATIAELNKAWRKHQKSDHKYAWVIERTWERDRPEPTDFSLKTHTIVHKRIDLKDAAAIW